MHFGEYELSPSLISLSLLAKRPIQTRFRYASVPEALKLASKE
jgi:hypothetical protein